MPPPGLRANRKKRPPPDEVRNKYPSGHHLNAVKMVPEEDSISQFNYINFNANFHSRFRVATNVATESLSLERVEAFIFQFSVST